MWLDRFYIYILPNMRNVTNVSLFVSLAFNIHIDDPFNDLFLSFVFHFHSLKLSNSQTEVTAFGYCPFALLNISHLIVKWFRFALVWGFFFFEIHLCFCCDEIFPFAVVFSSMQSEQVSYHRIEISLWSNSQRGISVADHFGGFSTMLMLFWLAWHVINMLYSCKPFLNTKH